MRAQALAADRSRLADTETAALLAAFGIPAAPLLRRVDRRSGARVRAPRRLSGRARARRRRSAAVRTGLRDGRMLERAWAELVADKSGRPRGGRRGFVVRKQLEFAAGARSAHRRAHRPAVRTGHRLRRDVGAAARAGADAAAAQSPSGRRSDRRRARRRHVARGAAAGRAAARTVGACSARCRGLSRWSSTRSSSARSRRSSRAQASVVDPPRIRLADGYRHMAIHPYPVELETSLRLPSGAVLKLRPIRPEDADLERAFVAGMSEQSRYRRFMQHLPALTPQMLARFTQVDYDRELALIALDGAPRRRKRSSRVARYVGQSRSRERGIRDRGRRRLARPRARPRDDAGADRVREEARLSPPGRRRAREQRADARAVPEARLRRPSAIPTIPSR